MSCIPYPFGASEGKGGEYGGASMITFSFVLLLLIRSGLLSKPLLLGGHLFELFSFLLIFFFQLNV